MTASPTSEGNSERRPAAGTAVAASNQSAPAESDRASTDPTRARYSLADQIACAERELGWRYRVYAGRVRDGKMSKAERDREIGLMRAIRNTLRAIKPHEDTIRAVIVAARERERLLAEADELMQHPDVAEVAAAFPGATITHIEDTDL